MTTATLPDAFAACETITRDEARNFYYGIRLLPPQKRAALCSLYALARRIDDIGDEDRPREDKIRALAALRQDLQRIDASTDPSCSRWPRPHATSRCRWRRSWS